MDDCFKKIFESIQEGFADTLSLGHLQLSSIKLRGESAREGAREGLLGREGGGRGGERREGAMDKGGRGGE